MYDFVDVTSLSRAEPSRLPVDDMKVNGRSLSDWVPGYRHLTVKGRGIQARRIKTQEVPGRRGLWVDSVEDKELVLEIQYLLEARTSADLRERFGNLNKVLRTHGPSGFLEIKFDDESSFTYYAILTDSEDIEEDSYTLRSSFKLLVPDGYKKKDPQNSTGLISLTHAIEVLPDSIIATVSRTTDNVQIINGNKILSFRGSYQQGKDIELDFRGDEVTIRYDNRSILSELERFSPLEVFTVKNRDTLTAKNASIKIVVWRDEQA